jgi:hypothetical protein
MLFNIFIIISSVIIFLFLLKGSNASFLLSLLVIAISLAIQVKQTRLTNFSHLTEIETIEQINRIHQYPNYAFRLGHIIEERKESIIFFKLEKNFIESFDLLLFPNIFLTAVILPFFIIGFFKSINKKPIHNMILICLPIILLTIIGHQNSSGPTCLYPIIFAYSLFSIIPTRFIKNEK